VANKSLENRRENAVAFPAAQLAPLGSTTKRVKMSGRVFLSHSTKDKDFVRDFDTALQAFGIDTFLDERDIGIGEDIPQRLYQELSQASHIIYFISMSSIDSEWVQEELSIGKIREKEKKGVLILPVLIENLPKIPTSISSKRYADFSDRTIDIGSRQFQLILAALNVAGIETINSDVNTAKSPKIREMIASVLLVSAELQLKLSDTSFLLRFATETQKDEISIRRLLETRNELQYRQFPESFSKLFEGLEKLKAMKILKPFFRELEQSSKKFFQMLDEVNKFQPTERPQSVWLYRCAETARYLQHRIGKIHELLLAFYFKQLPIR